MVDYTGFVSGMLQSVPSLIGKAFESLKNKSLVAFYAVISMLAMVAVASILVAGIFLGASLVQDDDEKLSPGGVDLQSFCHSYGYVPDVADSCSVEIDLDDACNWQHQNARNGQRLQFKLENPKNPLTGVCYGPAGQPIAGVPEKSGIRDMTGYCHYKFARTSSSSKATYTDDNVWICQFKVNMTAACNWQYNRDDLKAQRADKLWECHPA